MAMGAETMLEENRTIVHVIAVSSSLVLHALIRPYKDKMGNIAVVLFCTADLLGIVAGTNLIIQILFIIITFVTLLIVLFVAIKAGIRTYHMKKFKILATENRNKKKAKSEFTCLESILIWPVFLLLLWPRKIILRFILFFLPQQEIEGEYAPLRCCTLDTLCCRSNSDIESAMRQHFEHSNEIVNRNGRTKIFPQDESKSVDAKNIDKKLNSADIAEIKNWGLDVPTPTSKKRVVTQHTAAAYKKQLKEIKKKYGPRSPEYKAALAEIGKKRKGSLNVVIDPVELVSTDMTTSVDL